ncbi:hypothetical protein D3C80_2151590 [compost metagenome]
MPGTLVDQAPIGALPEACAIIDMGQLVQYGGEQLLANRTVWAARLVGGSAAVGETGQQPLIKLQG